MPTEHVVRQGEGLASIAEIYGFWPDTIWNHEANAELKKKRRDMNVLLEGDVVVIPDREPKKVDAATEKTHRFRRKGVPAKLRIQMLDEGEALAGRKYVLKIDGSPVEGKTDDDGWIEAWIPPGAAKGELEVEGLDPILLPLSHLDPVDTVAGVKARLKNLGYRVRVVDGEWDEAAKKALRTFQQENGLKATGEPDDATRDKLVEIHKS